MQLSGTTLEQLKTDDIGITIGSFDGVHKGHQYILKEFVDICKKKNLKPVVISFSPHPLIIIKNLKNFLIDSSHKKRLYLKERFDIELIEVLFDESLQRMSGSIFFDQLKEKLKNIKLFYAGHDFSLGRGKEFTIVEAKQKLIEIEVIEGSEFRSDEHEYSSTAIRKCLQNGEIQKANLLLGHVFKLTATVMDGSKLGRTIGFPTANLRFCPTQILPQDGVYFAKAIHQNNSYRAIVNIGVRPTVTSDKIRVVEVNLFGFNQEIYGDELDVEFYEKIRDEKKFSSLEKLKSQIQKDIEKCRSLVYYGRFGLIGKNINHSRSPAIYAELTGNNEIDYKLYDLEKSHQIYLNSFLQETPYLSVTSPYKQDVFKLCDHFQGDKKVNSVNCLKLDSQNNIIGTNTDYLAIEEIMSSLNPENFAQIIILGSGAMAELIQHILDKKSLSYEILSRKNQNINQLSLINSINLLIVNATSREFTPSLSPECGGVFWDLNYDQEYQEIFKKNKKIKYVDGKGLLKLQAKYALSFWNLKTP